MWPRGCLDEDGYVDVRSMDVPPSEGRTLRANRVEKGREEDSLENGVGCSVT